MKGSIKLLALKDSTYRSAFYLLEDADHVKET